MAVKTSTRHKLGLSSAYCKCKSALKYIGKRKLEFQDLRSARGTSRMSRCLNLKMRRTLALKCMVPSWRCVLKLEQKLHVTDFMFSTLARSFLCILP